jgi:hypothetical protein
MMMEEKGKQDEKKAESGAAAENDDGFLDERGVSHFHHDLIFEEDVPQVMELMKKLPARWQKPIRVAVPVDLAGFVKFFREKYRLCWKEIYLKIHALVYRPEQCKRCRKWFQLADAATCRASGALQEPDPLNLDFVPVAFHEIDHLEKDMPTLNCLT